MANILLGVTGSVAAIRTPALDADLRRAGHQVKVVATRAALYFFDPAEIPDLVRDEDEWPGRDQGRRWRRDDPVLHIELRRWADLLLIAPLDANTLAKLVCGLCDNCLTCVWRAWDITRPVVLAPAMNTLMWEHPYTQSHLRYLGLTFGSKEKHTPLASNELGTLISWINQACPLLRVVPPITKQLACGDIGVGAMAEVDDIVQVVRTFTV